MKPLRLELLKFTKDDSDPDDLVFTTQTRKKISQSTECDKCKLYACKAGLESGAWIYNFRHTYASHLVQRGIQIEELLELLGDGKIKQIAICAHLQPAEMHIEQRSYLFSDLHSAWIPITFHL